MGRMDGSMDVCPYIISMAGERERDLEAKRAMQENRRQTGAESKQKIKAHIKFIDEKPV